jgi:hypothetical protein
MISNLDRLRLTLLNIEFQQAMFGDDFEKLEHILANLEDGQSVHEEFNWNERVK